MPPNSTGPEQSVLLMPRFSEVASAKQAMVIFKIGEDAKTYYIHKTLLTQASPYFRGEFEGGFREAEDKEIVLSDVNETTFDNFVDWLYTAQPGICYPKIKTKDQDPWGGQVDWASQISSREQEHWKDQVLDLYIFADAHDVPALRHALIEAYIRPFRKKSTLLPNAEFISRAYAKLPSNSPFLRLLVHIHCRMYSTIEGEHQRQTSEEYAKGLPSQFLYQVFARYGQIFKDMLGHGEEICLFHEHKSQQDSDGCPDKKRTILFWNMYVQPDMDPEVDYPLMK